MDMDKGGKEGRGKGVSWPHAGLIIKVIQHKINQTRLSIDMTYYLCSSYSYCMLKLSSSSCNIRTCTETCITDNLLTLHCYMYNVPLQRQMSSTSKRTFTNLFLQEVHGCITY